MAFCAKCGGTLVEGAGFCGSCGAPAARLKLQPAAHKLLP